MAQPLETFTAALLQAAKSAGADAADAIAVDGSSISIDVLNGKLEQAERAEGIDIGLRVMIGKRQACVSASDTSTETIENIAQRAIAMAQVAPEDDSITQADPDQLARDWDVDALELFDPSPEPDPATLQENARRAEAAAMQVNGVSQVQSASSGYGQTRIHLATSNGFSGGYSRNSTSTSCVAITGSGANMERDYYGDGRIFAVDLDSPEHIGEMAAKRAVERADPRKATAGAFPVLYDERVSASLMAHLLAAINGASIVRGSSWLRDAMGAQILPSVLSLIEDPLRPRTSSSRPFDGEGLSTAKRAIIQDGVLTGWTLDLSTAQKLGLQSTGNASRGTSTPPSPSVGNIALTQGSKTRAELLSDMGTGLLVTSMIGSSINATTGDYSRGAAGFWVENGEIQYPVNECTIAGNLREMLATLIPANDARNHVSRVVPSLLVEGLILA